MTSPQNQLTKLGFAKTFVRPALLIFLIPALSLAFFLHAQSLFNQRAAETILQQIRADKSLSEDERARAIEYFTNVPFSEQILNKDFAQQVDSNVRFEFATFRWMIRLSLLSIISGLAVFIVGGICVAFSVRSQFAQYLCLSLGWNLLRIYGALQTIVLGILMTALSFWVTALWFNMYIVKLILLAAAMAVIGAGVVIASIFKTPKNDFMAEGMVLNPESQVPLWERLNKIAAKVGTSPPDQVVAGIDDCFYVTEMPLKVNDKLVTGKTLYVSMPLLKQLNAVEADAVLAHEMAHFSGQDTVYTKKIAPLLLRFQEYLQALYSNAITMPVFYFMNCFRAMFELSLGKVSRNREFRADGIAANVTSPREFSAALLRTIAYSQYRQSVEMDLFENQQKLDTADISNRIARGFPDFVIGFTKNPEIGQSETTHPFDSHPPVSQRLEALGVSLQADEAQSLIGGSGDGGWYDSITGANEMERSLWQAYEDNFQKFHEESLPYRFLPATSEEREIVEKGFPAKEFKATEVTLSIDCDKFQLSTWSDPLQFSEITNCTLNNYTDLQIAFTREGSRTRTIDVAKFNQDQRQVILDEFQRYYGRYLAAVEYQTQVAAKKAAPAV